MRKVMAPGLMRTARSGSKSKVGLSRVVQARTRACQVADNRYYVNFDVTIREAGSAAMGLPATKGRGRFPADF